MFYNTDINKFIVNNGKYVEMVENVEMEGDPKATRFAVCQVCTNRLTQDGVVWTPPKDNKHPNVKQLHICCWCAAKALFTERFVERKWPIPRRPAIPERQTKMQAACYSENDNPPQTKMISATLPAEQPMIQIGFPHHAYLKMMAEKAADEKKSDPPRTMMQAVCYSERVPSPDQTDPSYSPEPKTTLPRQTKMWAKAYSETPKYNKPTTRMWAKSYSNNPKYTKPTRRRNATNGEMLPTDAKHARLDDTVNLQPQMVDLGLGSSHKANDPPHTTTRMQWDVSATNKPRRNKPRIKNQLAADIADIKRDHGLN
jgi:hypothetical protein